METRKIPVFCYWNGCIKDGPDGPFYQEGSIPRVIRVESKTDLPTFLNDLHRVTGFDKAKFQIDLIGRYPSIVQQSLVKYMRLPIVDDSSLETMLEVPSYHPSITNVEFYLEVKPVVPLANNGNFSPNQASRKRNRQEDADVNANVRDNSDRCTEDGESTDDRNCGAAEKSSHKKKQLILSSSWLDESELQIGMLFRDKEELDNAVKLYSVRRQREYHAYESSATFECKNGGCGWILKAAETKGTGFKITKYRGPHTCKPGDACSDFLAGELQGLIKAQPSLSISELIKWVKEEFGYTVTGENMWEAKKKAITSILGDLDESFSVLPKFMDALSSSNKMVMDWQYDLFPDHHPKEASFRSVFWAFQQSIKGFPHLRPMIMVDTVELSSKHPGKMLVAAGFDAGNRLFPLAFAAIVTQERLSAEFWRWFFACIRKRVTQREGGVCLITSPDPEIIGVLNEPEYHQWAQHRFCLRHLCLKFYQVFNSNLMTELVYKAASSRYVSGFDYYLSKIKKMNPEAKKWLDQLPRHQWVLAYDDDGIRFGIMETNSIFTTYGFINKAVDLPLTTCVLLIFDHLAELFKTRRGLIISESVKRGDKYVKRVMTKLEEYAVASRAHSVLQLDQAGQQFQVPEGVKDGKKRFFVHLRDRVCACGTWQLCKYPCSHVLAVCRKLNVDHLQYVNDYYSTQHSLEVYAAGFNPLPGVSDWPEATECPRLFPPPGCPASESVTTAPALLRVDSLIE